MADKKALLVIDMLNDFIDPDGAVNIEEYAHEIPKHLHNIIEREIREGTPIKYI